MATRSRSMETRPYTVNLLAIILSSYILSILQILSTVFRTSGIAQTNDKPTHSLLFQHKDVITMPIKYLKCKNFSRQKID